MRSSRTWPSTRLWSTVGDSTHSSLLVLDGRRRPHATMLAALITTFDDLLTADRRESNNTRRPYPQLRLLAHAGRVDSDGQDVIGAELLTLHEHHESMIVGDALVGDDDVPVIAIASHQAFGSGDSDPNLVTGSVWIPAVNTPASAAPLRLWIRLPSGRPERALRT